MGLIVFIMGYFLHSATLLVTFFQVGAGIFIYLGILMMIKDEFLFSLIYKLSNRGSKKMGD